MRSLIASAASIGRPGGRPSCDGLWTAARSGPAQQSVFGLIVEEVVRVGSEHGEQRAPIRALGCLDEPVANRADGRRVSGLRAIAERRRRRHVEREGMLDRPRTAADRGGIGVDVGQGDEAAGKAAGGRDRPSDSDTGRTSGSAMLRMRSPGLPAATRTRAAMLAADEVWKRLARHRRAVSRDGHRACV